MSDYAIGVDIGTGSVKIIAMDVQGRILNGARYYYPAHTPGYERDPYIILEAFKMAVRNMVQTMGRSPLAVSLSSMMHGLMAVDSICQPITSLLLWRDNRSASIADTLRQNGQGNMFYMATGTPVHAMTPLCKIRWIRENKPEVFNQAFKFISIKEFIWYHLFGEFRIDHSLASATGLFNLHNKQWDQQILDWLPLQADKLSEPVPVSYSSSFVFSSMAEAMAIPANTRFIIGASDGCLANLGTLCLEDDVAGITIGTSAAVRITCNAPRLNESAMPFNYVLDEEHYVCGGAINNGGNIIQWLVEKFMNASESADEPYEVLFEKISGIDAGCNGLIFLPFLHGERAPLWQEHTSGVYFGIKPGHTNDHFLRAGVEGICFALQDNLQVLEESSGKIRELRLSGGLTRYRELVQMFADVTGKKTGIILQQDASCAGACYLALRSMGLISNYHVFESSIPEIYHPEPGNYELYRKNFETYRSLYPLLLPFMKQQNNFHPDNR